MTIFLRSMPRTVGFAAAFLTLTAGSALAQPEPDGSFTDSCQNIQVRNGDLRAQCRTANGNWNWTTLDDYEQCDGDIANLNGELVCREGANDRDTGPRRGPPPPPPPPRGDGPPPPPPPPPGGWNNSGNIPNGSYRQTCRNVGVDGNDLDAECQDRNGRYRDTTLDDYRRCRGDIMNDNGNLRCNRNDDDDDDRDLPRGSWRDSCRNYDVRYNVLTADCRNRAGQYVDARLDLRSCNRDVVNDNGRLVCAFMPPPPPRNKITLYRNIGYGGTSRAFVGDTPDLGRFGFNDIASSAAIQGGRWQLCTRAYYRGRCVILDRNTANFLRIGMNDRVRSVRELRR